MSGCSPRESRVCAQSGGVIRATAPNFTLPRLTPSKRVVVGSVRRSSAPDGGVSVRPLTLSSRAVFGGLIASTAPGGQRSGSVPSRMVRSTLGVSAPTYSAGAITCRLTPGIERRARSITVGLVLTRSVRRGRAVFRLSDAVSSAGRLSDPSKSARSRVMPGGTTHVSSTSPWGGKNTGRVSRSWPSP